MSIELIVVLLVVLAAVLFLVLMPAKNLSDMLLQDGEVPLFDEGGVTVVEDVAVGTNARHIRCRVSVTDRRLVISQLPLLGKKFQVIMVLYFSDAKPPEKTGLEGRVKTGVLDRDAVQPAGDGGKPGVLLRPSGFSAFNRDQTVLEIQTSRWEALKDAVQGPGVSPGI